MSLAAALLLSIACIPGLDAPRTYEVDMMTRVEAANLDGDRYPDVVTSHQFGVEISYGRGNTLAPPVTLLDGQGYRWQLADVDADARPDFVVTHHAEQESVTFLLRNLGSRRFGAPETIARTARAEVQAVLDFTGDGSPDLLIPRGELPALLAVNDGRGQFTVRETAPVPQAVRAAGDLDGDGDGDLVLHAEGPRATILRSNGNGGFAAPETRTFPTTMTPALADLDSDGRSDLLALLGWGQIEIYPGAGVQPASKIAYAGTPRDVVTADFNGDGAVDVAIYSQSSTEPDPVVTSVPRLLVYLSDGRGGFVRAPDVLTGSQYVLPGTVDTADFDRDGTVDMVVPGSDTSVALVFGNGDGTFDTARYIQTSPGHLWPVAADLDGDGIDELITRAVTFAGQYSTTRLSIGWLTPDGTYAFESLPAYPSSSGDGVLAAAGTRTIVTAAAERLRVYSRTAPGTWVEVVSLPVGKTLAVGAGDVTGDGRDELMAVVSEAAAAVLRVYDAGGNTLHSLEVGPNWHPYGIVVAELTGDGKNDLLVLREGSFVLHARQPLDGYLALLPGRGDGTFDAPRRLLDETRPGRTPLLGDYNGDGRTDIASAQWLLLGDGRGNFAVSELPFSAHLAADVNRDGITDVVSGLTLWQGTRTGVFIGRGTYMFPFRLQGPVIVRRTPDGPPSLLGIADLAGEFLVADFTCAAARRRTARP